MPNNQTDVHSYMYIRIDTCRGQGGTYIGEIIIDGLIFTELEIKLSHDPNSTMLLPGALTRFPHSKYSLH